MNEQALRGWMPFARATGILGSFLVVAGLVWAMHHYTQPPPVEQDRAAVRAKALADLRGIEAEELTAPAWLDQSKGLLRLPIENAMQLVLAAWGRNPTAARSNLIARVEKATAPPPRVPEKPSPFE
jgi:hypothetical protein